MKLLFLSAFLFLINCKTTGDEQERAYVKGNVITSASFDLVELQLQSENTIVSKTMLDANKNFTISGPLLGKSFFLICNQKIKSISGNSNLKISADSLSIVFPAGVNYVDNLEIKLSK